MAGLLWSPWIGIHASYMLGAKNGRTGLYLAMVTRSNGPTLTNTSEWKLSWQDAEAGKVPNHWNAGCRHASHESNRPTTSLNCVNLARFREGSSLPCVGLADTHINRILPVSRLCIMPCLIWRYLASLASSAAISASMSERT